jgi:hypothetical protein
MTPPDECSAIRRDVHLTTRNAHKGQTSTPAAVFEPTIPGSERPQTNALERVASGIGFYTLHHTQPNFQKIAGCTVHECDHVRQS